MLHYYVLLFYKIKNKKSLSSVDKHPPFRLSVNAPTKYLYMYLYLYLFEPIESHYIT